MMKSLVFNELHLLRRNTVVQIVVRRSWLNNQWQAIIFHQSVSKISQLASNNTLTHPNQDKVGGNFGTESIVYMLKITYSRKIHVLTEPTKAKWQKRLTLATIAVFAPKRAAMMHWLAPFPPKPIENFVPCMVSPALGSLGT